MSVETEDMGRDEAVELKIVRETAKAKADRLAKAWERTLATPEGRAVIWDIIGDLGLMRSPFVPGAPDMAAFNMGAHNEALKLHAKIGSEWPAYLLKMQQENMR